MNPPRLLEPTPEPTTRSQTLRALARLAKRPRALARTGAAIARGAYEGGALGLKAMLRETARGGEVLDYDAWVARYDSGEALALASLRARLEKFRARGRALPSISVVIEEGARADTERTRTEASLGAQVHAPLEVVRAPREARGDYLLTMKAGDRLPPHALAAFALAASQHDGVDALYADHDHLCAVGRRCAPSFKTSFSSELFEAHDYVGPACIVRRGVRFGEGAIVNVPFVLYHARTRAPLPREAPALRTPPTASLPLVSVVIPTRDRGELLRRCVESLRARTDHPVSALELVVVDNGSREVAALEYLAELERSGAAQVLRDARPFHFGALNNAAVRRARGEVVVLLNNDVELVERGWLRELLVYALRPGVGAVGGKLLYANGRVQHAGIVLGMHGVAGHVFKGLTRDAPGYGGWAALPRNVSAVTAACLAVRRDVYLAVGGFDEDELAVEYGDVDFCMRVSSAGHRNVFTPRAVLVHHESSSRGAGAGEEAARRAREEYAEMVRRHGDRLLHDPFWSPNLSLWSESVAWANPPRVRRSW